MGFMPPRMNEEGLEPQLRKCTHKNMGGPWGRRNRESRDLAEIEALPCVLASHALSLVLVSSVMSRGQAAEAV